MRIVCLANSYKEGGYCFAGKDIDSGRWVRPVSTPEGGPLFFRGARVPRILDIVDIPEGECAGTIVQPENMLVRNENWAAVGSFPLELLGSIADEPDHIWMTGALQDRVSRTCFNTEPPGFSLMLVMMNRIAISSFNETYNGYTRRKVRVKFDYKGKDYNLCVTSPELIKSFSGKEEGEYEYTNRNFFLTLSLGLEFRGFCYKLAASIIAV